MDEGKALRALTIGHSTLPYEEFVALLRAAGATAIADVRSSPYSRYLSHFNRETLRERLRTDGLPYVFLGDELGGRPKDPALFRDGVADYDRMAVEPGFKIGLQRVIDGAKRHRIALMCSEHDPLDCHRCLLVGRALSGMGVCVSHIVPNRPPISQDEIEQTLLAVSGRSAEDLFASRSERVRLAYRERARKVAFAAIVPGNEPHVAAE